MITYTMKSVSCNKIWNRGTVQVHVDSPPIPITKINSNDIPDKYCVKIKLWRDLTSHKLGLCEFKTALFDNSDLDEFLLFISNFSMTLEALGVILGCINIQYFCTLVGVESLYHFDMLYDEVGSSTPENFKSVILGFGTYFFPVNALSK